MNSPVRLSSSTLTPLSEDADVLLTVSIPVVSRRIQTLTDSNGKRESTKSAPFLTLYYIQTIARNNGKAHVYELLRLVWPFYDVVMSRKKKHAEEGFIMSPRIGAVAGKCAHMVLW